MPELPEMETYKRLLTPLIVNKQLIELEVERVKSINVPLVQFINEIKGYKIIKIDRRAKNLIFSMNNGKHLLLHLMLGGSMYYGLESTRPNRSYQIRIAFGQESLYFIGLRLGYLHLLTGDQLREVLEKYGPEPLGLTFSVNSLLSLLKQKRGRLKLALVDQKFIAGIGNCYSDEICFEAGILPSREIVTLTEHEQIGLFDSIKRVLQAAIAGGGYMDMPLYQGDAITGGYDEKCKVYDREGELCTRCGGTIVRDEISSRKMFFCPNCQK